jgi:hypothetical protein
VGDEIEILDRKIITKQIKSIPMRDLIIKNGPIKLNEKIIIP